MPQAQIDPATGERVAEIDPATGERVNSGHGASSSWDPAPRQSFLTQPIGEHFSSYKPETDKLRSIATGDKPEQQKYDVEHAVKSVVRRTLAGSEADLSDMLTPLFAGSSVVGELGKAPGAIGTLARTASRAGAVGFGAKGAYDAYDAGGENTPESWAKRLSGLSQMAAAPGALGGLAPKQNREARLSSGAGLTQGEEALKPIVPELDKTLKSQGKTEVKTIGEFQSLVRDTNGRLEAEYQGALKPIGQQRVNTRPISQAIQDQVTPNMLNTRDGQIMSKELLRRAAEFGQNTWSVEELDMEREKLAKSYDDGKPSSVAADLKLKARTIADRAANKVVNDILYSMADQAAGKPTGYFKGLKQKQSTLFNMVDDVKAQKESVTAGSAQKKGKLLRESVSPWSAAHPKTGAVREAAAAAASKFNDPLKTANEKVRRGFSPAPRSTAPGQAVAIGAAAEAEKRHPSDVYSDPANAQ